MNKLLFILAVVLMASCGESPKLVKNLHTAQKVEVDADGYKAGDTIQIIFDGIDWEVNNYFLRFEGNRFSVSTSSPTIFKAVVVK